MSKFSPFASLCALVPVTVLLSGCGGSSAPSALPSDLSAVTQTIGSFTTRLVGAAQAPMLSAGSGAVGIGIAGASVTDLTQSFISKNLVNTKIAYFSLRDGNHEIYAMNADGTGQTRLTNNKISFDGNPSWSPDGSKIVFQSDRDGNGEIYAMNSDGTNPTRLTNNSSDDNSPSWSPDGSKIVFHSTRNGNSQIYSMNVDGTNPTRLTNNSAADSNPSWSPDGSKIAFFSTRDGDYEIYTINADGTNPTRLTNKTGVDSNPAWSPEGNKIAFRSERDGNAEIYTINADGTNPTRLTNNTVFEDFPSWSPDGNKIVFRSGRDGNSQIYSMNTDGTNQIRLTNIEVSNFGPSWSGFRRPKYIGVGGILATECAGFILGKKGSNAFDTSGTTAGTDTNASVLIFDTPLAARSTARVNANTNPDTTSASLVFTISTTTGLSSIKFINTNQSLAPIAPILPAGTTGAIVLLGSSSGAVTDVVPYTANRSVGSTPKRVVSGDTATYTGSFPAVFDETGKNIAPSGAHSVTLNEKTGKLVRFE